MKRLVTVSGPQGAGKDALIGELLRLFPFLEKLCMVSTRSPRTGEQEGIDYRFVTPAIFDAGVAAEKIGFVFPLNGFPEVSKGYRNGFPFEELNRVSGEGIANVSPAAAIGLRQRLGGISSFLIFLSAPPEDRLGRVLKRDDIATDAEALALLKSDPVPDVPEDPRQFDLVVENPDGQLDVTVRRVMEAIEGFLGY